MYEKIDDLKGKTLTQVENRANEELMFRVDDGTTYRMWHSQDCCASCFYEALVLGLAVLDGGFGFCHGASRWPGRLTDLLALGHWEVRHG